MGLALLAAPARAAHASRICALPIMIVSPVINGQCTSHKLRLQYSNNEIIDVRRELTFGKPFGCLLELDRVGSSAGPSVTDRMQSIIYHCEISKTMSGQCVYSGLASMRPNYDSVLIIH